MSKQHTLLFVDDEVDNVDALERLFRSKYNVLKATSGPEALELVKKHTITVIVSDQRMPGMTGVEFLGKSLKWQPHTIRILLTGYTDIESVISAINKGEIYRYVNKPWDPVDLKNTVDKAVEKFELRAQLAEKNEQLERAYQELKTLDEAKSHFMYLVNHELKTPLTTILSFTELLQESRLDEEQTMCVKQIQKSGHRLQRLIFDVLQIVSSETGQLPINPEKIKIRDLVEALPADVQKLSQSKNIKFKFTGEDFIATADRQCLSNVFHRLIYNSVKYSPDNATVNFSVAPNNETLEFEFVNPSEPLSKEKIQSLLQPFTVDEDILHHGQGTGLGLAVCQALLKTHNSQLQIDYKNKKTHVKFSLPKVT